MMKVNVFLAGLALVLTTACNSPANEGEIKVDVIEVIQVEAYTYLLVASGGDKPGYWIAVPSMEANPGESYSYTGGMEMADFHSRELDRTFDKVLFVEGLRLNGAESQKKTAGSKVRPKKADVELQKEKGSLALRDIFSDPGTYEGETIQISGVVTRINKAIMHQNWVHLQDGTEFKGKYELTATTSESFEVGDTVTLEGILALDLDFGHGYVYDILLQKAKAVR